MSDIHSLVEMLVHSRPVDSEIFQQFTPEQQEAIRILEARQARGQYWRNISTLLMETAYKIANSDGRDEIVNEIVHSARMVLHADIGYISFNNEEENRTEVLTTAGVITDAFKNIRMPLGTGVLGLVASRNQSVWTEDHATDVLVTHVKEVDAAVEAEGIHGILGAPLTSHGTVCGALLVGDRNPRRYTKDEILTLESLASLCSVMLEKARQHEELEMLVAKLRAADSEHRKTIEEQRILDDSDTALLHILSTGARYRKIHAHLVAQCEAPVWFFRDGALIDADFHTGEPQYAVVSKLIAQSSELREVVRGHGYSAFSVSVETRELGAIVVNAEVDDICAQIIARAGMALATTVLFKEAYVAAENRQVDDLMRKIMRGAAKVDDYTRLHQLTHVNVRTAHNLCLATVFSPSLSTDDIRTLLKPQHGVVVFEHSDHVCILVANHQGTAGEILSDCVGKYSVPSRPLYIGAVHVPHVGEIAAKHQQAEALAHVARSFKLFDIVATPEKMGSLGLILGANPDLVRGIIEETAGKLLEYDRQYGTELAQTALCFLDHGHSVTATAKELFVHSNTVRQRLERISSLLGKGWDSGRLSFETHLGLSAWRLLSMRGQLS